MGSVKTSIKSYKISAYFHEIIRKSMYLYILVWESVYNYTEIQKIFLVFSCNFENVFKLLRFMSRPGSGSKSKSEPGSGSKSRSGRGPGPRSGWGPGSRPRWRFQHTGPRMVKTRSSLPNDCPGVTKQEIQER